MILTAPQLKKLITNGKISITDFNEKNLKGVGYTFTLSTRVKTLKKKKFLDSREDPEFVEKEIGDKGYEMKPGDFAVFYTKEKVTLNGKFACLLSTRATIAQMGLDTCQGSILCEPDTDNPFALEITNRGPLPIQLFAGTKIVKGIFIKL